MNVADIVALNDQFKLKNTLKGKEFDPNNPKTPKNLDETFVSETPMQDIAEVPELPEFDEKSEGEEENQSQNEDNAEQLLIKIKTNIDQKKKNVANFEKMAKGDDSETKKKLKKTSSETNLKKAIEKAEEFKNSEKKELKDNIKITVPTRRLTDFDNIIKSHKDHKETINTFLDKDELNKLENIDLDNLKPEKNKDLRFRFDRLSNENIAGTFKNLSNSKTLFKFDEVRRKGKPIQKEINSILDKKIKISFAGKQEEVLEIAVPPDKRIGELIQDLMNHFDNESLFKYDEPQAYEVRMYDDFTQGPDVLMPPFERNKQFKAIKDDHFVICQDEEFIKQKLQKENEMKRIESKIELMSKILETEPHYILVSVSCEDEGISSTIIKLKKTDSIKKIYDHFKKRIKNINIKDYYILQKAPDNLAEDVPLHNHMLVKDLTFKHLLLKRKRFIDRPRKMIKEESDLYKFIKKFDLDSKFKKRIKNIKHVMAYTDVTACVYESFEVVKIYSDGRREKRLLAIDGSKIYSLKVENRLGEVDYIGRTRERSKEQNISRPQRFLNEVKEYKLLAHNLIRIRYKSLDGSRKFDLRLYETNQAEKIFIKLDYLLRIMLKKFAQR